MLDDGDDVDVVTVQVIKASIRGKRSRTVIFKAIEAVLLYISGMQRLRIELLPWSYDLPPCDRPRLYAPLFSHCQRFVLGP
jgi:hypothetical protein